MYHRNNLVTLTTLASTALLVAGQSSGSGTRTSSASAAASTTPLAAKRFTYPGVPYQVDTDNGIRGRQVGYNQCNSTTEGPESLCQTAFINSIEDFCLWAPPEPDSIVGNVEGEMVAWCTQPGRGTRLIPPGALKGVQFTRAETYIQVVGFIDQTQINIQAGDYGGEMDPHGADQRGNPLGGLLFSQQFANATGSTGQNNGSWSQVVQWHNFMGADMFCLKACNPSDPNGWRMCEHIYDRIGCAYNAPANYSTINGTFTSCDSDDQLYPGYYVGSNGQTSTYTQPPESLGVISTINYTPVAPSISQCTTYTSASIYTGLGSASSAALTSAAVSAAESAVSSVSSSASAGVGAVNNAATAPTQGVTGGSSMSMAVSASLAGVAAVGGALALLF